MDRDPLSRPEFVISHYQSLVIYHLSFFGIGDIAENLRASGDSE
jgi:hypothetical protein